MLPYVILSFSISGSVIKILIQRINNSNWKQWTYYKTHQLNIISVAFRLNKKHWNQIQFILKHIHIHRYEWINKYIYKWMNEWYSLIFLEYNTVERCELPDVEKFLGLYWTVFLRDLSSPPLLRNEY